MKMFRIWCCRNDPVRIKSFWRIKEKAFHFNSFEYKCFNEFNIRRAKVAKKCFRLISSQFLNNGHFTWSSHTIPSTILNLWLFRNFSQFSPWNIYSSCKIWKISLDKRLNMGKARKLLLIAILIIDNFPKVVKSVKHFKPNIYQLTPTHLFIFS